jgi:hypothetical protein
VSERVVTLETVTAWAYAVLALPERTTEPPDGSHRAHLVGYYVDAAAAASAAVSLGCFVSVVVARVLTVHRLRDFKP